MSHLFKYTDGIEEDSKTYSISLRKVDMLYFFDNEDEEPYTFPIYVDIHNPTRYITEEEREMLYNRFFTKDDETYYIRRKLLKHALRHDFNNVEEAEKRGLSEYAFLVALDDVKQKTVIKPKYISKKTKKDKDNESTK